MKKYIQIPILLGLIVSQATINRIEALNWKETLYTLCALGGIGICAYRIVQKNKQNEALIKESEAGNTEIVEQLITAGADVNVQHKESTEEIRRLNEELLAAVKANNSEQVGVLLTAGAQVNAQEDIYGRTALMEAAWYGDTAIVEQLITAGADVNAQNIYDATALIGAARYGRTDIIEILLDVGANASLLDQRGQKALDEARKNNHQTIVEMLEEHERNGGIGLGPKAAFMGVGAAAQN
jgi:uncharacterized protein